MKKTMKETKKDNIEEKTTKEKDGNASGSSYAPREMTLTLVSNIVFILKCFSTREHPMTRDDILHKLNIIGNVAAYEYQIKNKSNIHEISDDTLKDNLKNIMCIMNETPFKTSQKKYTAYNDKMAIEQICKNLKKTFIYTYGGEVKLASKKNQIQRYYFEPLLKHSDVSMINGAIISNPYLTEDEKDYLTTRVRFLSSFDDIFMPEYYLSSNNADNSNKFASSSGADNSNESDSSNESDEFKDNLNMKTDIRLYEYLDDDKNIFTKEKKPDSIMLRRINKLDEAIRTKKKITFKYGEYQYDESSRRPKLIPKTELIEQEDKNGNIIEKQQDKEYKVDPYALCWNGGFYYLICRTRHGLTHFRVDRMIDLPKICTDDKDKYTKPPTELSKYFKQTDHGRLKEFDALKYRRTYPLMSIYKENDTDTFKFETSALSILVDYFGNDIHLEKVFEASTGNNGNQKTPKCDTDYNNKPKPIYRATIRGVDCESGKLFALQQHSRVHLVAPPRAAREVRETLQQSANYTQV
ncbi:WYL domain-containing protein [Lachnospiraceae bacterium NE2001]|nr:WYL domain-containing protein [Lachnospiraceae bacterium NE2001]